MLGAFLFDWRAALISVVAIPLSLVAAGLVLYWRGTTINVMVLAGLVIALGVVVDDAIIGVQNILRRLRENHRRGSPRSAAAITLEASLEVRAPIVYATLIILIAMVPIFFLQGLTGAFFRPLVLAYVLAVLVSLVVALTVTPALSLILLSRTSLERGESPVERVVSARLSGRPLPRCSRGRAGRTLAAAVTVRRRNRGRAVPRRVADPDVQGA